jgi:hypothetical protein
MGPFTAPCRFGMRSVTPDRGGGGAQNDHSRAA